jgi:type II secretory pathway component PulF
MLMASRSRLAQAYYDLAVLLDAGVPITRSLDMMIQGREGHFKHVLSQVRESLSKGSNLSESLDKHPAVFPELDRMLIEAAETSGSLGDSFKMLSQWHEFIHRITRRMQMGLLYPVLILHIGAMVIGGPDLILGEITVVQYLVQVLQILLLLYVPAIAIIVFMSLRGRIPAVALPMDYLVLRIPILGAAIYHLSVCRYARAFAMMYKGGVPITETTTRATRATGNLIVARQFAGGIDSVRSGGTTWEGFSRRLPAEYRDLWQIGEETGELDKMADKVAEIAADRADLYFTQFAFWFPWVVYAIIAGFLIVKIFRMWSEIYGPLTAF